jgi:P4 family phage/plasmid primase-like protien
MSTAAARPSEKATAAALRARSLWPTVIYKGQKRPIGDGWGENPLTLEEINGKFRRNPGAGVGVCLGPGRGPGDSWLVDFEVDGDPGEESLRRLLGDELPATMSWTSRRGPHRVFKVDGDRLLELLTKTEATEGKGPKVGVWKVAALEGLEIRVGGHHPDGKVKQVQSVCPPSISEDGTPREWIRGPDALSSLPEAAYAFLEALAEQEAEHAADRPHEANGKPRREASKLRAPATDGYAEWFHAALREESAKVAGTGEGDRHNQLIRSARNLGGYIHFGYLNEQDIISTLAMAGEACGLPRDEIAGTIRDGIANGKASPMSWPDRLAKPPANGAAHKAALNEQLANKHRTDLGNAERLAARYGSRIRYCHPWAKWLAWDGRRWASDQSGTVRRLAKATARRIPDEARHLDDDDRRKALILWGLASESRDKLSAMVDLAASEDGIPVLPEQLDANRWLLNVQNGTLDLKTGKLLSHRREDMITALSPIPYDSSTACPVWLRTLEKVFGGKDDATEEKKERKTALIKFWQRLCGLALTGEVTEQILPILYGTGANGKTTLLTVLLEVLGPDYAVMAPPGLLMVKRGESHPTERAILFGKRLVVDVESAEGARLNEEFVKQLTGSDRITAKRMREDFWDFSPTHKVMLCTNHKPVIEETKNAIWRRVKLIPFSVSIPESEQIKDLPQQHRAEYPGILAWFVQGCLDWQRKGLGVPAEVAAATEGYRNEQDVLGEFVAQECAQIAQARAQATRLFDRYRKWTERTGEETLTQRAFGMAMTERGFERKTNNGTYYLGIGLRDERPPSDSE